MWYVGAAPRMYFNFRISNNKMEARNISFLFAWKGYCFSQISRRVWLRLRCCGGQIRIEIEGIERAMHVVWQRVLVAARQLQAAQQHTWAAGRKKGKWDLCFYRETEMNVQPTRRWMMMTPSNLQTWLLSRLKQLPISSELGSQVQLLSSGPMRESTNCLSSDEADQIVNVTSHESKDGGSNCVVSVNAPCVLSDEEKFS